MSDYSNDIERLKPVVSAERANPPYGTIDEIGISDYTGWVSGFTCAPACASALSLSLDDIVASYGNIDGASLESDAAARTVHFWMPRTPTQLHVLLEDFYPNFASDRAEAESYQECLSRIGTSFTSKSRHTIAVGDPCDREAKGLICYDRRLVADDDGTVLRYEVGEFLSRSPVHRAALLSALFSHLKTDIEVATNSMNAAGWNEPLFLDIVSNTQGLEEATLGGLASAAVDDAFSTYIPDAWDERPWFSDLVSLSRQVNLRTPDGTAQRSERISVGI